MKAGATGSSAVPPGQASKPDASLSPASPSKTGATGSSAFGQAGDKPAAGASQGATRVGATDALTDGPILDLKAKRIPDSGAAKAAEPGAAKSDPAPKADPLAPTSSSGGGPGLGTIAASGLIGGVIGAGLFFALAQSGSKPDDAHLAALDRKVADLAPRDTVSALDKRVALNEQALKTLPDAVKTAVDRADEALQKSGAAPAASAQPAPGSGASPDLLARIDALDQRVSALQEEPGKEQPADSKLAVSREGDDGMRLANLDERLKALEAKGAERSGAAQTPDLTQTLTALQGDIEARTKVNETADKALAKRIEELQQSLDARVKSATEAVQTAAEASKQSAEASKTQAEQAAKGVERRFQEQGDRLAALDKAVDGAAKAATLQAALRAVAAERIVTALNSGAPYADALTSLRNADPGGDASRFEALAPFADTGAPSAASLAATFKPIREKILAAQRTAKARTVAETGSFSDRVAAMASSIVRVKGTDTSQNPEVAPAADADPSAKVEEALDRGQAVAAAEAFAALPADLRATAGDFGKKLQARADAESAAQSIQADAFKSLSGSAAGR